MANARQTEFLTESVALANDMIELYKKTYNMYESFQENFSETRDNDLSLLEGDTTVDADSEAAQKVLNVTSTTNFKADQQVIINEGGDREEINQVETVGAGVLNLKTNLLYTHTAAQADEVKTVGDLKNIGLTYEYLKAFYNQPILNYNNFFTNAAVTTRDYGADVRKIGGSWE